MPWRSWRARRRYDLAVFSGTSSRAATRRIEVQTHNVLQFFDKLRIPAELKGFYAMGLQSISFPHPAYAGLTDAGYLRQAARALPAAAASCGREPSLAVELSGADPG